MLEIVINKMENNIPAPDKALVEINKLAHSHLMKEIELSRQQVLDCLTEKYPNREELWERIINDIPFFVGPDSSERNKIIADIVNKVTEENMTNLNNISSKIKLFFDK